MLANSGCLRFCPSHTFHDKLIMKEYIYELQQRIPVTGTYDVAVVGGGVAGIAVALSSARAGARTVLLECQFALGGLATLGTRQRFLPPCVVCDRQVSFGIVEELLRLFVSLDDPLPEVFCWKETNCLCPVFTAKISKI